MGKNTELIIDRLRDGVPRHTDFYESVDDFETESIMEDAADLLEFFFNQMKSYSPQMSGHCSYCFRGGWPMNHAIGLTKEDAIRAAIKEVKRDMK